MSSFQIGASQNVTSSTLENWYMWVLARLSQLVFIGQIPELNTHRSSYHGGGGGGAQLPCTYRQKSIFAEMLIAV